MFDGDHKHDFSTKYSYNGIKDEATISQETLTQLGPVMYNVNPHQDVRFSVLVRITDVQAVALYQHHVGKDANTDGFFVPITKDYEAQLKLPQTNYLSVLSRKSNLEFTNFLLEQMDNEAKSVVDYLPQTFLDQGLLDFDIETAVFLSELTSIRKPFNSQNLQKDEINTESPKITVWGKPTEQIEVVVPHSVEGNISAESESNPLEIDMDSLHSSSETQSKHDMPFTLTTTSSHTSPKTSEVNIDLPPHLRSVSNQTMVEINSSQIIAATSTRTSSTNLEMDHFSSDIPSLGIPDSKSLETIALNSEQKDLVENATEYELDSIGQPSQDYFVLPKEYDKLKDEDVDKTASELYEHLSVKKPSIAQPEHSKEDNDVRLAEFSKLTMLKRLKAQDEKLEGTPKLYLQSIQPFLIEPLRRNVALMVIMMLHTMASNFQLDSKAYQQVMVPSHLNPTFPLKIEDGQEFVLIDDLYNREWEPPSRSPVPIQNQSTVSEHQSYHSSSGIVDVSEVPDKTLLTLPDKKDVFSENFFARIQNPEELRDMDLDTQITFHGAVNPESLKIATKFGITELDTRSGFELNFQRDESLEKSDLLLDHYYLLKSFGIEFFPKKLDNYFNNFFYYESVFELVGIKNAVYIYKNRLGPSLITPQTRIYQDDLHNLVEGIKRDEIECPVNYNDKRRILEMIIDPSKRILV